MSFTCRIPVANIVAANAALAAQGHGPQNFTIPVWTSGPLPTHATLNHGGRDDIFQAHCAALPGAVVLTGAKIGSLMPETMAEMGARWGDNAPLLQGQVTPPPGGGIFRAVPADGGGLWFVITGFDRNVFSLPLSTYPSLCRKAKVPGLIEPWVQPNDQFDAYYTKNAFTGQPDRVTHNGRLWRSTVADPTPNVWPPGTAGVWADEGPAV